MKSSVFAPATLQLLLSLKLIGDILLIQRRIRSPHTAYMPTVLVTIQRAVYPLIQLPLHLLKRWAHCLVIPLRQCRVTQLLRFRALPPAICLPLRACCLISPSHSISKPTFRLQHTVLT